uniref:Uncharacterized protein n=1 Tax=Glossina palpalis gambiensis TaxID=67801 RepID=A0A1B0C7U0_9MUSC
METCVLIPQEFSLAINALTNNNETDLTVWTCSDIPKGQLFYPFQGTIRIDKLNIASSLQDDDKILNISYGKQCAYGIYVGNREETRDFGNSLRVKDDLAYI